MSQRQPKRTQSVVSTQIRDAIVKVAQPQVALAVEGGDPDDTWLWEILLYASANAISIESACNELAKAPSGNTTRESLQEALCDQRPAIVVLEAELNAALQAQLPPQIRKPLAAGHSYEVAIDLHDIPYHGPPALSPDEIRHGPAKGGTTQCHSYATLASVHDAQRYEVALSFVWADETLDQVGERLITLKNKLNLHVRRVYLDKGFCSQPVFNTLRAHRLPYIIPIPLRGKKLADGTYGGGIGRLFSGRRG